MVSGKGFPEELALEQMQNDEWCSLLEVVGGHAALLLPGRLTA